MLAVVAESPSTSAERGANGERDARSRIVHVTVDGQSGIRLSPTLEHERRAALFDLLESNHFALCDKSEGPYIVHLNNDGERIHFTVCNELDLQLTRFSLSLGIMRRIIKEYFMICESYFSAIKTLPPSKIEAIDMGRRGLHNEGADLLRELLSERVDMDADTARRLFTLVCVMQIRR